MTAPTSQDILAIQDVSIRSTAMHTKQVAATPDIDVEVCKVAGKTVRLTMKLDPASEKQDWTFEVRGQAGPNQLFWNEGFEQNTALSNANKRTFIFHLPPHANEQDLSYKFCTKGSDGNYIWENLQGNRSVSLKDHGSVANIKVRDVMFS